MYDMYPAEWGPAAHHPDNPFSVENVTASVQASFDQRDDASGRPDDN